MIELIEGKLVQHWINNSVHVTSSCMKSGLGRSSGWVGRCACISLSMCLYN